MTLKTIKDLISTHTRCRYNQKDFFIRVFPEDILVTTSGIEGDIIDVTSDSSRSWLSKLYNDKHDSKSGVERVRRTLEKNIRENSDHLSAISANCKELLSKEKTDIASLVNEMSSQVKHSGMTPDMIEYLNGLLHSEVCSGVAACIVCSCCQIDPQLLLIQLKNVYGKEPMLPVPESATLAECLKFLRDNYYDFYNSIVPGKNSVQSYEPQQFDLYKIDSCKHLITHINQTLDPPQELIEKLYTIHDNITLLNYESELRPESPSNFRLLGKKIEKIIELEKSLKDLDALILKQRKTPSQL